MGQSKASEALVEVEEGPRGGGGQAGDMPPSYSGLEVAMGDKQPPCYQVMGGGSFYTDIFNYILHRM